MKGLLYQAQGEIEDVIKDGISYFMKKYNVKPVMINVNPSIDLKVCEGVPLKKDKHMYTKGLILMIIPEGIKLNGE